MGNILDYVNWRNDLSFAKDSFNIVDSLILSQITYVDYEISVSKYPSNESIGLSKAINKVFQELKRENIVLGLILPNEILELTKSVKDSIRYQDIKVSNYVNIIDNVKSIQFSAITYQIDDNNIVICFRGTDDSLIGWKEDLDMICKFPIPSQELAVKYINDVANIYSNCNIYLAGHSKGGNLANYGSIYCDDLIKDRIVKVYCFDSPGFEYQINTKKFEMVKDKIVSIIPSFCVIGLIFNPFYGKRIITMATRKGIRQHDVFTWQVYAKGFIEISEVNENALKFNKTAKNMLSKLSHVQRNDLADDIYIFITNSSKNTLIDCTKDPMNIIKYISKISAKNRKLFIDLVINFYKYKMI